MFNITEYPNEAQQLFWTGPTNWPSAVEAAGKPMGLDGLADLVFYMHHPERMDGSTGQPLTTGEENFEQLSAEWRYWRAAAAELIRGAAANQIETRPNGPKDVRLFDLRERMPEPQPKSRIRNGRTVMRTPADVTGIMLHQTACEFGVSSWQLKRAGGDRALALALRAQKVACHLMAFRDGLVSWTRPLASYVQHGNGLNQCTIGIEIEGNYAGLEGRTDTAWSKRPYSGPVSKQTILAARKALSVAVTEGRRQGMPITHIYAHRQSSAMRRADPGAEIWKSVALDYGVKELGLAAHPGATFKGTSGEGRPVPREWDPEHGVGNY